MEKRKRKMKDKGNLFLGVLSTIDKRIPNYDVKINLLAQTFYG